MIAMGLGPLAAHAGKFPCLRGLRLLNERLPGYFYSAQEESCIRTDTIESEYRRFRLPSDDSPSVQHLAKTGLPDYLKARQAAPDGLKVKSRVQVGRVAPGSLTPRRSQNRT